jgi:hypothetical protein
MDISELVTVAHEMKRGNYAVRNSDSAGLVVANGITEFGTIARDDIREALIGYDRQAGTCEADASGSHNRHERGSLCAEHCVQREPIQRGLLQQIERSTWSMAVTLGQTRVVITQTNTRSTQVCATSI